MEKSPKNNKRGKGVGKTEAKKRRRSTVVDMVSINAEYVNNAKLRQQFQADLQGKSPFPHWQLHNFVDNSNGIVEDIETELQNFPSWRRKENDLYSLYQTADFKSLEVADQPSLFTFRQFMYGTVREWLSSVSGVSLTNEVDMNGSCYSHTDGLLPHSDLIETRRFAFVYYVTPFIWDKSNGGELNLYNSNEHDEPTTVAVKLPPTRNSLVLFEVSHRSWHRVAEILSSADPRLSINGWFHSERRLEPKIPKPFVAPRFPANSASCSSFAPSLFNKDYLDEKRQSEIKEVFGDCSELCLKQFLQPNVAKSLLSELSECEFKEVGPPNKRHLNLYDVPSSSSSKKNKNASHLGKLTSFLRSKDGVSYLQRLTDCDLKDCQLSLSISRLNQGCYTVVGDEDAEQLDRDGFSLEVNLFLSKSDWVEDAGGDIIYVGRDQDEELIHITPESNSLSIVLKDPDVFSFTKYVNSRATSDMYVISVVVYNVNMTDSGDEE